MSVTAAHFISPDALGQQIRVDNLLDVVLARRSIHRLIAPAPTQGELEIIIKAAGAAPDYGRMRPWRFTLVEGADLAPFAERVVAGSWEIARQIGFEPTPEQVERLRATFAEAAPMILVAGAAIRPHHVVTPIKQQYAVAAAAQNALLAATALGYGSMWRTGMGVDSSSLKATLELGPQDAIVGFLFLGTIPADYTKPLNEGGRPELLRRWKNQSLQQVQTTRSLDRAGTEEPHTGAPE